MLKHAPVQVGQRDQRALFDALLLHDESVWHIEVKTGTVSLPRGGVEAALSAPDLLENVARRVYLLQRMRDRIERRSDVLSGTTVFKGTRASVERVGALLKRGRGFRTEVAADYPKLSAEDLEIAELYVRLNSPKRGRPLKRLRFRRSRQ